MHRFHWKNRLTMTLGVAIASMALLAACAEDNADDNGVLDPVETTPVVTVTPADGTPATTPTETTATVTPTEVATEPEDVTLSVTATGMMQDGVATDSLTLVAGSTVTFENETAAAVTLTSDDGSIEEEIDADSSYDHTFDDAGIYRMSVDGQEVVTITITADDE